MNTTVREMESIRKLQALRKLAEEEEYAKRQRLEAQAVRVATADAFAYEIARLAEEYETRDKAPEAPKPEGYGSWA